MNHPKKLLTPGIILQVLFFIVLIPFLPLFVSWHWNWWEAWVYGILSILSFVLSRLLVARRHPDLIAERARTMQHEDAQPWDKRLARTLLLVAWVWPILMLSSLGNRENRHNMLRVNGLS